MKSTNTALLVALILVVMMAGIIIAIYYGMPQRLPSALPTAFTFNKETYNFTFVASTPAEQEHGLMNYTVTNSTFELFVFGYSADFPFWMKNTYYPLDMIWVEGNTIVYIANATPCYLYSKNQSNCMIYDPRTFADSVIETKSGFVNDTGMKVGDNITFVYGPVRQRSSPA